MALSKVDLANQVENQLPQSLVADNVNFRNIIINGDMSIDQRNGGSSVSVDGGAVYTLDRYLCQDNTDGSFSIQQSTTAPTYFKNSMVATITGTDSSLTTTQFGRILQRIEGQNTINLAWGTANAKTVTLSFYVRSSVTGTFGGSIVNSDGNRVYAFSYTISSADTWEKKSIIITGDTSGTWLTTNGMGIEINFGLGAGPDRSVAAGSWGAALAYNATGATNLFATSGATFYITGIQLEAGTTASDFEFLPYDVNLQRCQRYFQKISSGYVGIASGWGNGGSDLPAVMDIPVKMRATPTFSNFTAMGAMPSNKSNSSPGVNSLSQIENGKIYFQTNGWGGTLTNQEIYLVSFTTNDCFMSAEL